MEQQLQYFDEFPVGATFETARHTLDRAECVAFAQAYDPQPFHLDDAAGARSVFGTLVASGWLTAAVSMRLLVTSGTVRSLVGTGIDDLRWHAVVKPGDTLRVRGKVVELRDWPGSTRSGIVRVAMETLNQDDRVVMSQIANVLVPRRPPG